MRWNADDSNTFFTSLAEFAFAVHHNLFSLILALFEWLFFLPFYPSFWPSFGSFCRHCCRWFNERTKSKTSDTRVGRVYMCASITFAPLWLSTFHFASFICHRFLWLWVFSVLFFRSVNNPFFSFWKTNIYGMNIHISGCGANWAWKGREIEPKCGNAYKIKIAKRLWHSVSFQYLPFPYPFQWLEIARWFFFLIYIECQLLGVINISINRCCCESFYRIYTK